MSQGCGHDLSLGLLADFSGNDSRCTFTSGAVVPDSLIQYSNRDVRAGDPAGQTKALAILTESGGRNVHMHQQD